MWINRQHTQKISDAAQKRPVLLLTGIRQAGKSSLLRMLFPDAEYVTLDRLSYAEEAETNPSKFLARFENQVIIDEIQYSPSLFRDLKISVDENREQNGKWILTGSQQFTLMQSVSESLAGRARIIRLHTLSSNELIQSGLLYEKTDILWKGGFPELWAENLEVSEFFDDYLQTYLEKDLRQILNVSNLRDFRRFVSLLAIRTGHLLNYSELSNEVGVAVNTIKAWVNALEISGLIILLPPYYNNLGKRLIKAPKLYFCDNGIAAALLNINSCEIYLNSPHSPNLWENYVLTEYIKEGFRAGKNLFYYRDQNAVEIDFILEKNGQVYLVEAKNSERPNPKKLNFGKIAHLLKQPVNNILACNTAEKGMVYLKDFSVYNPLDGNLL